MLEDPSRTGAMRLTNGRRVGTQAHIMPRFVSTMDSMAVVAIIHVPSVMFLFTCTCCASRTAEITHTLIWLSASYPRIRERTSRQKHLHETQAQNNQEVCFAQLVDLQLDHGLDRNHQNGKVSNHVHGAVEKKGTVPRVSKSCIMYVPGGTWCLHVGPDASHSLRIDKLCNAARERSIDP